MEQPCEVVQVRLATEWNESQERTAVQSVRELLEADGRQSAGEREEIDRRS